MSEKRINRPADDAYFVPPWSANLLQGDIFMDVPIGIPMPPDAVVMAEGERRFLTGPFDAGPAMLVTPSCAMAAQGEDVESANMRTRRGLWCRSGRWRIWSRAKPYRNEISDCFAPIAW